MVLLWQTFYKLFDPNQRKLWRNTLVQIVGFHLIGLLLASYKLYFILSYQRDFPRTVEYISETTSLWNLGLVQLVPTWGFRYLGGWEPVQHPVSPVWESSHFNVLIGLCLSMVLWKLLEGADLESVTMKIVVKQVSVTSNTYLSSTRKKNILKFESGSSKLFPNM
jgi:hypothetical protein